MNAGLMGLHARLRSGLASVCCLRAWQCLSPQTQPNALLAGARQAAVTSPPWGISRTPRRSAACREIQEYLTAVLDKRLPVNHDIMAGLQDVLNLLPNLNVGELTRAFSVKSNDMMLVIYVASLVRSVLALHNLLNNKVSCW